MEKHWYWLCREEGRGGEEGWWLLVAGRARTVHYMLVVREGEGEGRELVAVVDGGEKKGDDTFLKQRAE